jgi:Leucine-rich repeat (LRR) protein
MDLSGIPPKFRRHIDGTIGQFSDLGWTELPDWFVNLTNLTLLDLRGNQLSQLPDTIGNLINRPPHCGSSLRLART